MKRIALTLIILSLALPFLASTASAQGSIQVLLDLGSQSLLGGMTQVQDGTFYGVAGNVWAGPPPSPSEVFQMDATGNILWSYTFPSTGEQGLNPNTLLQASDGNLYGTDMLGGNPNDPVGTAFRISGQTVSILHAFQGSDGANPYGGLAEGNDGYLYGTTLSGGANNLGTVFRMDMSGNLQTIFTFDGSNGANPNGGLIVGPDDILIGSTIKGGTNDYGSIFAISTGGHFLKFHSFPGKHACPNALTLGPDGNIYGTTQDLTFSPVTCSNNNLETFGSIFRVSPKRKFTTVYEFNNGNGIAPAFPSGPLLFASDGNAYGVTDIGGDASLNPGTIFQFTPAGQLSYSSFQGGNQGASPCCELLQSITGNLLGVTQGFLDIEFGPEDAVVFSAGQSLPAPPPSISGFAPQAGQVGQTVTIRGDHFLATSLVTFNGVAANSFAVQSTNFITATVPQGATTGPILVTNPGGTATSAGNFTVQ